MKDLRVPTIVTGFTLFMLGIAVAYIMIGTPDTPLISEQNKQNSNNQSMRGVSDLVEKLSELESTMAMLHNTAQGKNNNTESSQILGLLEKIRELEKKIDSLSLNLSVNKNNEQVAMLIDNKRDLLAETEASELAINAHYQGLEDDFQSEQADPQWSLAMNDKIKNSIDKFNQDSSTSSSVLDMDCKSTLCRVELSYDGSGDLGFMELNMLQSLGDEISDSSSKLINDSEGNVSGIVYYFARQGHSVVRSQQNP